MPRGVPRVNDRRVLNGIIWVLRSGAPGRAGWAELLDSPPPAPYFFPARHTPGFIEACLPSPAERPPIGPDWVHEIKHDGYRLMARRDPAR